MMVVIINVMIDEFHQFSERLKPIQIAGFRFEMAVKGLFIAVLPG